MTRKLVVLVTCGSAREANRIAQALIEERLAACVSIHPAAVRSVYRWKGKIERAREILLIAKTSRALFSRLEPRVRELHGYETPEIIALPIDVASRPYLEWLDQALDSPPPRR